MTAPGAEWRACLRDEYPTRGGISTIRPSLGVVPGLASACLNRSLSTSSAPTRYGRFLYSFGQVELAGGPSSISTGLRDKNLIAPAKLHSKPVKFLNIDKALASFQWLYPLNKIEAPQGREGAGTEVVVS